MARITTEEWVRRAKAVHGDLYDYSQVEYTRCAAKVKIVCRQHGVFLMRPMDHVSSKKGCPTCSWGGTIEERFWAKVDKNGEQVLYMPDPCWEWTAYKDPSGYGKFGTHDNVGLAHVFSYELAYGPIERDENGKRKYWVCHKCDRPGCVRPSHLFLGTDSDNMNDAAQKGRLPHKLTSSKVLAIRDLFATGQYSHVMLGRIFGVKACTIRQVLNRITWKYL